MSTDLSHTVHFGHCLRGRNSNPVATLPHTAVVFRMQSCSLLWRHTRRNFESDQTGNFSDNPLRIINKRYIHTAKIRIYAIKLFVIPCNKKDPGICKVKHSFDILKVQLQIYIYLIKLFTGLTYLRMCAQKLVIIGDGTYSKHEHDFFLA